jgi:hypothetical protein
MDPITVAIVAAIAAGAAAGAGQVAEKAIVDAYEGLKGLIKRKLGADNKVSQAVAELEKEPEFEPNKAALEGRVKQAKVDEDADIKAAAQALLEQLKARPGGEQHIQTAIGSYIAQADRGSTASVNVNQPKE